MNWRRQLISVVLIFFLGACTQYLFFCGDCLESYEKIVAELVAAGFLWVALWKGSEFSVDLLNRYSVSWVQAPLKRFIYSVATVVGVAAFSYFVLYLIITVLFLDMKVQSSLSSMDFDDYIVPIAVTLAVNTFMHGRSFLLNLRQKSIDNERLKTEQIASQLNSLRDQVNPHFLFNSLNALSSLVYDDQKKAVKFIQKLSDVYRYVLDQNDKELVTVADELKFMESYFFLLSIRFDNNFVVKTDGLSSKTLSLWIPPMSLQLLVENAIKHNVVSENRKLQVEILDTEGGMLLVRNNINLKKSLHSKGIGLKNLRLRYEYLSDRRMIINHTEEVFEVFLPLLEVSVDT